MANQYIKTDPWRIIERQWLPERVKASESLFSIGNGRMGQRANFEEAYSGQSLPGSYIGGVYYPDKTRVGWWKNGYPDYFAKVLNSAFWIGIDVEINGKTLDLGTTNVQKVEKFYRELDMRRGVLTRRFEARMADGVRVEVEAVRFVSLARTELGAIRYGVRVLDGAAEVTFTPYINADVRNQDANYDEHFWEPAGQWPCAVQMRTRKTNYEVCWHAINRLDGATFEDRSEPLRVAECATVRLEAGQGAVLYKYAGIASSLDHRADRLPEAARQVAQWAAGVGFDELLREHEAAWEEQWARCDVAIEGDEAAQQGIRFCVFHLLQTYTGADARLNVGPKGFTGEKYGGGTYWDTEAYCIPFYMATAGEQVARRLLKYRYDQLDRAIENAEKLGFGGGAALYPMVTMNGQECHNEWEITFEEIHRNGAIAYAIHNYIRYTDRRDYLLEGGLEVLIGIARFWAQRITFSDERQKYVMLGVTGPNEYENNVNNNWYTNYIALWCLEFAEQSAEWAHRTHPAEWRRIAAKTGFDAAECDRWRDIRARMHLPSDEKLGIFLQQDGYLDKEQILVEDLDPAQRPLNQKWSWDRILRSCFCKQADVLQGIYFFRERFDEDTIRRNFDFWEARTVHESSLSPCVHAILAAQLGLRDKAMELYLRTARLDLDDYNREIDEGLHITSMAGSWLAVVEGFGGMRVRDGKLGFSPALPETWRSLSFRIEYRGEILGVRIDRDNVTITKQ